MSKTKLVATFGPASESSSVIRAMLTEGVNCARLNFSHGSKSEHGSLLSRLKRFRKQLGAPLSLIADTKGPEVRMQHVSERERYVEEGEEIYLRTGDSSGDKVFSVNFSRIGDLVSPGSEIIVGDGELSLTVSSVKEDEITCRAEASGKLVGKKKITIPGTSFPLPSITNKDEDDIRFAVEKGVDWIALSFIKEAEDIRRARSLVERFSSGKQNFSIMAKIETVEAVENIEEIARESDGLMVARGDLAMALGLEEVPFLQKKIISLANDLAKPVVTATQMLESMVHAPSPTRAEVTDVANAVLDGTDAVMLSGETAIGDYPVKSVATMRKISEKAEANFPVSFSSETNLNREKNAIAPEIGRAACTLADRLAAKAIITSTRSGYTARLVSRFRPKVEILAITPYRDVYNKLAMVWGVIPLKMETVKGTDQILKKSIDSAKQAGYLREGDLVVLTAGVPFSKQGTTNLLKVERAE